MSALKRLFKPLFNQLGYDIRKMSHLGLDPMNDIQTICSPASPRVIFDVGAHRGETAAILAHSFPDAVIHSFEPTPATFAVLQRAASVYPNVRPVNAALGATDGVSTMHVNAFSPTNSFLAATNSADDADSALTRTIRMESVKMRGLDSYCEEAAIDFIDLLKMDVQGFELEVLRGAERLLKSAKIAFIYSEVMFAQLYAGQPFFEDVARELTRHGFEFIDFYGHVRSSVQSLRWCDALFVHPQALLKGLKGRS